MNKFRDKRIVVPCVFSVVMVFTFVFLGINNNFIFDVLKGNSVTESVYYYCKDPSYTLEGRKCTKTIYADKLLVGDANLDGEFNVSDVTYVQLYMSNRIQFNENQFLVSDVNVDNVINDTDLLIISKAVSGYRISMSSINDSFKYNVGIDKICPNGYESNSNNCEKKDVVNAIDFYYIPGDVNTDKKLDNKDLEIISGYLNGKNNLDRLQLIVADVNHDGVVNINDFNKLNSIVNSSVVNYFTIKYNANGGTGTMTDQIITYGNSTPLNENKFVRQGYTFKGWRILNNTRNKWACYKNAAKTDRGYADKVTCDKYGYQLYNNKQSVSETANAGEVITMYAQWEKNPTTANYFTIKYNANGGTGTMTDQIITYGNSTPLNENKFVRQGYTFKGWRILNNTRNKWACYKNAAKTDRGYADKVTCDKYGYQLYNNKQSVSETANVGEIITMYAQWEKNPTTANYFTIKYNANGGTGTMTDQIITYGNSTPLNENKFVRQGYTFKGWRILNNTRNKWACYKNATKTSKGYADKVTCDKYGYQLYNNKQSVSETANVGEVITMYAQWEKNPTTANYFTIKYNANGGTGTMTDQIITYGNSTPLNENKFVRQGYTFKGWRILNNTRNKWACYKNATKTSKGYADKVTCDKYGYQLYNNKQSVSETANAGEVITMYAQWEKNPATVNYFTIKYNANGGKGTMSAQKVIYDSDNKLTHNEFTNNGKLLQGWRILNNTRNKWACYKNAAKTSKGYTDKATCEKYGYQIYRDMQPISATANPGEVITMYAQWYDLKNAFSINAEKVFTILELPKTGLYRQKVIQDIYVNGSDIYVSQDNFNINPDIKKDPKPSELIITKISRSNLSMQEVFREKRCGHGFFTIPGGVLMTTCDVDTEYDKDAHGHKAYKIPSKDKRVLLFDAFKNQRETFKIDFNSGIYMARINDGKQKFRLYKYDKKKQTVGSFMRSLEIDDTKYDMQGYALDGKYIYIYHGEGIDSGSNRLKYSIAYIDTYDSTTGKLIKSNKIFESKNFYIEAEGLDYYGDYVYIGLATTNEYNSAYGDYKYANVYRIKKSDLR